MKTLLLVLILSVPAMAQATEPSASEAIPASSLQTSVLAFDLPHTVETFGEASPVSAAPVVSALDMSQSESMTVTGDGILIAPLAAPEPSSIAFAVWVLALFGVLFLRMRALKNSETPSLDTP